MSGTRFGRVFGTVVMGVGVLASSAVGQPSKKGEEAPIPPTISKLEEHGPIVPYMLAFILIGAIVGISAIPSKRGHQD